MKRPPKRSRATLTESAVAGLTQMEVTQVRKDFSQVVSRVGFQQERIAVSRNGKVSAVLVSPEDFERFVWLEDYLDGVEGKKALEEFEKSGAKAVSSAEVARRLGIK